MIYQIQELPCETLGVQNITKLMQSYPPSAHFPINRRAREDEERKKGSRERREKEEEEFNSKICLGQKLNLFNVSNCIGDCWYLGIIIVI